MPAHCERRSYCFRVSQKAWHCKQSDAGDSRDSLLTWIAVTCAPENVPHCQRLREIREFWRGIPVAGAHARSGEEIFRRAVRVNCSRSNYALSCIGRWTACSIIRLSSTHSAATRMRLGSSQRNQLRAFRVESKLARKQPDHRQVSIARLGPRHVCCNSRPAMRSSSSRRPSTATRRRSRPIR